MKNKVKYIIVGILILILASVIVFLVLNKNQKKVDVKNKTNITALSDDKLIEMSKKLLQEDHAIKDIIYGNVKLDEATLTFDKVSYNHYPNDVIKSVGDLHKLIANNYATSKSNDLTEDFGKYNEIIMVDKEIYVKTNPKCVIDDFNKDIKMVERHDDYFIVQFGKEYCQIYFKDNKLILLFTPYDCPTEKTTTTQKTES